MLASSTFVSADTLTTAPSLTGLTTASVTSAIARYFSQRNDFLLGSSNEISSTIPGIVSDESAHLTRLSDSSTIWQSSQYTILSIECGDTYAVADVSETVTYIKDNQPGTGTVEHSLTLYLNSMRIPVVAADGYYESFSGFESASYVPDSVQTYSLNSTGGSAPCIIHVANAEIGTKETGTDITKYGEWFGSNGVAWCAIFVSWCANEADVSTSIIKKTASCDSMVNDFMNKGGFYYSSSYGGTSEPQVGDIFFTGDSLSDASHVGIIVSVDSTYIYVVDGNWSNKVSAHTYKKTNTSLLGFGRPAYVASSHTCSAYTSTSTGHSGICTYCEYPVTQEPHVYTHHQHDSSNHWQECDICSYASTTEAHSYTGYQTDATYHWRACTTCAYETTKTQHIFIDRTDGTRACRCGLILHHNIGNSVN